MYQNEDLTSLRQRPLYGNDDSKVNYPITQGGRYTDLETKISEMKMQMNDSLGNKDNRLVQLEKDREFLILKNFELEKEINRLDQMFSSTFKDKTIKQPVNNNNKSKQLGQHKQPDSESTILKKRLKELEGIAFELQTKVNNTRSRSAIRLELTLWKNRTLELSQNYKDTLEQLNNELAQDKTAFKSAIKKIQTNFVSQVKQIESDYKGQMEKNEKRIAILQRESMELKKKEEKVKEIFMYNFK